MALRKKKYQQQSDEEKLQELLKKWDIQMPDKKSDFPETDSADFPKADFPETKQESIPEKKEPAPPKPERKKQAPQPEKKIQKEIQIDAFLETSRPKKTDAKTLLTENPDLDRLFKAQAIRHLHGTVRMYSMENIILTIVILALGLFCMHGVFTVISIICFFIVFFMIWYMTRWELKFDGKANRLSYQSLFHEEIQFHASQIQQVTVSGNLKQELILTVYGREIRISLGVLHVSVSKDGYRQKRVGGYYNAYKLQEYLNFYQDLHGNFSYSGFSVPNKKSNSFSKEELMNMLAEYQDKINQNNQE